MGVREGAVSGATSFGSISYTAEVGTTLPRGVTVTISIKSAGVGEP